MPLCRHFSILVALCLLLLSATAFAQAQDTTRRDNSFWQQYMELWASQSEYESLPDDWQEVMEALQEHPVNINEAVVDERLLEIPFLSPQHLAMLRAYIEQTGPLFSLGELQLVPGFDPATVRLMAPFVVCGPQKDAEMPTLKQMLTQGRSNIVAGTHRTLEQQRGYKEGKYVGDPFRYYLRYRYRYKDNLELQLSADQDPGEAFVWDSLQRGFDYYGFHLMLQNFGCLRRAIVGNYQLQLGQGLTLWSGFAPWNSNDGSLWRYGRGIRPASAFSEYDMLQGAAATVDITRYIEATAFVSYTNRDATQRKDTANGTEPIFSSIYRSGYHRTQAELDKRNQLQETLFGANLRYHRQHLTIGATAYHVGYDRDVLPKLTYYNAHYFRGNANTALGLDASYRLRNWLFFAEASLNPWKSDTQGDDNIAFRHRAAYIAGLELLARNNGRLSLSLRHFDTLYVNTFAAPFALGSTAQSESGLFLSGNTRLPGDIDAVLSLNVSHFPLPKYQIREASNAALLRLWLSWDFPRGTISLQYRLRSKAQSTAENGVTVTHQIHRHVAQLFLRLQPSEQWSFTTRADLSLYHVPQTEKNGYKAAEGGSGKASEDNTTSSFVSTQETGFLLRQTINYTAPWQRMPITLTGILAYFDAQDYDVRLYAMESDFLYEMGQVMYYGRGFRTSLLIRCNLSRNITLSVKYSYMLYPDVNHLGNNNTQIDVNHRQEIKAQLRMTF